MDETNNQLKPKTMELTKQQIEERKSYIGKKMVGFRFEANNRIRWNSLMQKYIGFAGIIVDYNIQLDSFKVDFESSKWSYPAEQCINRIVKENESLTLTKDVCTDILMKLYKDDLEILVDETSTPEFKNRKDLKDFINKLPLSRIEKLILNAIE